ncbi:alpha-crystallin B chain-like [Leptinotarsa decemlineata]|uniref:alpha-crystallin B chain-like n=1 Tax=Leptinotarsa decemlineata TaxID=7539 RepID=UPI003D30B0BA
MSLFPYFFRDVLRPLRMMEHQMKLAEEMFHPSTFSALNRPRYTINLEEDLSQRDAVIQDKEKFQVKLDVQDFKPEEIVVKTLNGNAIQIEAKHEEKHGEDKGFISKHLIRRFVLPRGHDLQNAVSSLSSDGVLTITAPKKIQEANEKVIPICHEQSGNQTGEDKK